ncbi:MAG: VWA domain-containing protein [Sphingobacteriia bacterium]|jgi:Ca-activated chloride channel homolog|nr:VWA domain-containing protein [Sphingobacteriia bacterium]
MIDLSYIRFESSWCLWFLLLVPVAYAVLYLKLNAAPVAFSFPYFKELNSYTPNLKIKTRLFPFHLKMLSLVLLIIALAGPQSKTAFSETEVEGVDMIITLDVSVSMLSKDFNPDRITVAKRVLADFISKRQNDRIALVTFGGFAHTQCPLTIDHKFVLQQLQDIEAGTNDQGTAIGSGIGMAVARLNKSNAKSKVLILVSDGVNNAGEISPEIAGDLAQQYQIRVYSIGVGKRGKALSPARLNPDGSFGFDYTDVEIDEALLKGISKKTGGMYYRATSLDELESIYKTINALEKTKFDETLTVSHVPYYRWVLIPACILWLLSWILKNTYYKTILY